MKKRKQNSILILQDKYLETKDEKILSQLYIELTKLGRFFVNLNKIGTYENVQDIVVDYIIRLIDDNKKAIKIKHPSAYMKSALFFISKNRRETRLLELEDYMNSDTLVFKAVQLVDSSFEEDLLDNLHSEKTFNCIYKIIDNYLSNSDLDEEEQEKIIEYIIDCLEGGKYYKKYLYKVNTKKMKDNFKSCFELIEETLKEMTDEK